MSSATYGFISAVIILVVYELIKKRRDSYKGDDILAYKKNPNTKKKVKAPYIKVLDNNGNLLNTKIFKNSPLVINFYNTTRKNSKKNLEIFADLSLIYKDQVNFINIFVPNSLDEEKDTAAKFLKQNKIEIPLYLETKKASEYYDVKTLPETFFIDKKGHVLKYEANLIDQNKTERQIRKLLN